ncbi:MAG TPA: ubiquinone-dependent pyruvate dehydrogenase [Candidatus Saccharimonadales bacterium]|nr:ubiquinone-dependent pyruvate dehydrogenase [Candidatus Saccharimonadales bacterium]
MTTVATHLVQALVAAGVQRIYGVVGDSLNSIVDAVHHSKKIEWIHVRHEEAGAFAASAEAQLTGKLAVCAGSCGPGNLHLINGLYDAHKTLAPVLAIAAQIPSSEIGTGFFQETHPENLFKECSHFCQLIATEKQMPRLLQIAMQTSTSRGGVSVLVLPGDVASSEMTAKELEHRIFHPRPAIQPASEELQKLSYLLNNAERATIFGGAGCVEAHEEVLMLAKLAQSPVVYSFRGKEFLEHDNPYAAGMTGLLGTESGHYALEKADLVLMLGTDFPYTAWYPKNAKIVQIDSRAEHLGRRCKLELGLVGDTRTTIKALLPLIKPKKSSRHLKLCREKYEETRNSLEQHARTTKPGQPLHPEYATKVISELADRDAIFTVDTGMTAVWAARYLEMQEGQRLIGSFNHGSMANALPHAIGAQLAFPKRQVFSLSGDGGFTMLMGDILTLVQYDLPIRLVIFNNSTLGMVKLEMRVAGLEDFGVDLKPTNFAKMAEALGIRAVRIENGDDLKDSIKTALRHRGPVLLDIVTDPNALAFPPKLNAKEVAGYGLFLVKQTLHGKLFESIEDLKGNLP